MELKWAHGRDRGVLSGSNPCLRWSSGQGRGVAGNGALKNPESFTWKTGWVYLLAEGAKNAYMAAAGASGTEVSDKHNIVTVFILKVTCKQSCLLS